MMSAILIVYPVAVMTRSGAFGSGEIKLASLQPSLNSYFLIRHV